MKKTDRMSIAEWQHSLYKANKYGAKAMVEDGVRFDSTLERDRYLYWNNMRQIKAIAWFTRQVPFYLPGGIVWRADFLVVNTHDTIAKQRFGDAVIIEDCKGVMTRVSQNKIKQVEAIYGFKVEIIKRGWKR